MATRGVIVSFRAVENFDGLSEEAATKILYEELVPACEAKGIMLSYEGNHADGGSSWSTVEQYSQRKASRQLFDVKRVQKAYSSIPLITKSITQFKTGSYGLKHVFERHPSQSEYLRNGDLIAAMLVNGHQARFPKYNGLLDMKCDFKVKVTVKE